MSAMCITAPEPPTRSDFEISVGELGQAVYVRRGFWPNEFRAFWSKEAAERWIERTIRYETWVIDNSLRLGVMY